MEPDRHDAEAHATTPGGCKACATFARAITTLSDAGVEFLVGGGFAVEVYIDTPRAKIKDLDLFLRPTDVGAAMQALNRAGFRTRLHEAGWLGKAFDGDEFIDLIYATRNELLTIDDASFVGAPEAEVLGQPVRLQPIEEVIATKLFVCARDRFDVADITHLILRCSDRIDWRRLIDRLAPQIEMLEVYLMLFQYIYPGQRRCVPDAVYEEVSERARTARERPAPEAASRGLALDPVAFAMDIERWGFFDARKPERLETSHAVPVPAPAESSSKLRKVG